MTTTFHVRQRFSYVFTRFRTCITDKRWTVNYICTRSDSDAKMKIMTVFISFKAHQLDICCRFLLNLSFYSVFFVVCDLLMPNCRLRHFSSGVKTTLKCRLSSFITCSLLARYVVVNWTSNLSQNKRTKHIWVMDYDAVHNHFKNDESFWDNGGTSMQCK